MNWVEIDRYLGQTPCLCGATDTWHVRCFVGKTEQQVKDGYKRAYAKVRRRLKEERIAALAAELEKVMKP